MANAGTLPIGHSPRDARIGSYLLLLLVTLSLPVAAVFAFNLAVDPLLYRWPRAAWQPQPAYLPFDREVHYNLVVHARPRALLLGNSQTQHGFVPAHWPVPAPVVNAAMVGADVPEMLRALRLAQAGGHVDAVLAGIDFAMTRGRVGTPPSTHEDFVVAPSGAMRPQNLRGLFSFTLLRSSVNALVNRYHRHLAYFAADGQALDPLYAQSVAQHGGTLGALAGRLGQFEETVRQPPVAFDAQLRALRDQACAGGTRLTLFLTPLHALWLEALDDAGMAGAWAAWKRDVTAIAAERPTCRAAVWDFNSYNPITEERLPAPGDPGDLRASWDGVHFRPWVGDRILARIRTGTDAVDGFGVRLTPATVDAALARDVRAGVRYRAARPDRQTPDAILALRPATPF